MKIKLLSRYLFWQLVPPLALTLILFTVIFLARGFFDLVDVIVAGGLSPTFMLQMFATLTPPLFVMTLPMALLLATLLVYGKLAGENEINAMRTAGMSYRRILAPGVCLGLISSLAMLWWCHSVTPRAIDLQRQLLDRMLTEIPVSNFLRPGEFIDRFGDYVIYFKNFDEETTSLSDVVIFKTADDQIDYAVLAPTGTLDFNPETLKLTVLLNEGSVHNINEVGEYSVSTFTGLSTPLDVKRRVEIMVESLDLIQSKSTKSLRKDMAALKTDLSDDKVFKIYYEMANELHRRTAIPVACLIMVFLAVPLGVTVKSGNKSISLVLTLGIIVLYYFLMAGGQALVENRSLTPLLGAWIPNLAMILVAIVLNWRVNRI